MTTQDNNKVDAEPSLEQGDGSRKGVKLWYAISLAIQLGFLVVIPIGGFILLGHWGDTKLQTSPFLLIAGVMAGLFATVYEVYHLILPLTRSRHD